MITDAGPPVFFDLQSLQHRWSAERGIGRYVSELLQAIDRLVPKRITHLLLNPDLPVWESLDRFIGGGRFIFSDRLDHEEVGVLHLPSPFEPFSLERLWPPQLRSLPLVVTVHDLIPDVFRSDYLSDARDRRAYRTRLELVRRADRVLVPSQATAEDVKRRLGIDSRRIALTPEGVSNRFRPGDRATALDEVRVAFPRIRGDFVLYTGGVDPRKNVTRLLAGFGRLAENVRKRHQLVIVSGAPLAERRKLEQQARELGILENVVFTGFVSDELLVRFYQAARVFVLPSLYEGYGLPIVEARACNAAVLAGRAPGTTELVNPESTFDPYDVEDLAVVLGAALVDDEALERLRGGRRAREHTWTDAARRTVAAYDELAQPKPRPTYRPPRVAFAAALPPRPLATAQYNFDLLASLQELCHVDVFTDGEVELPEGVGRKPLELFEAADRIRGGYDAVLSCLAATAGQSGALSLLRRRPAAVLAHDVRLTRLESSLLAEEPGLEPRSLAGAVTAAYGPRVAAALEDAADAVEVVQDPDRFGVLLAREVIAHSALFLVHSQYDAELAGLDASPRDEAKIDVVPFGFRADGTPGPERERPPLVATFGAVKSELQVERFIEVVAGLRSNDGAVEAAIVMRGVSARDRQRWLEKARARDVDDLIEIAVDTNEAAVADWLERTTIAVEVDRWPDGELWAATARCLAQGIPTIVSGSGYSRTELPGAAAVVVERNAPATELARVLEELLRNDLRRTELADAASEHARRASMKLATEAILERVLALRPLSPALATANAGPPNGAGAGGRLHV